MAGAAWGTGLAVGAGGCGVGVGLGVGVAVGTASVGVGMCVAVALGADCAVLVAPQAANKLLTAMQQSSKASLLE